MSSWTSDEEQKLLDLVTKGYTTEEIAHKLNRSFKSIAHRRADLTRLSSSLIENRIEEPKKVSYVIQNIDLMTQLKGALTQIKTPLSVNTSTRSKSGDTLMIHFTDWHIGRIVKDESGHEIYNAEIFKQRINKLLEEILLLLDEYISKGTPIKDVVIMSTGDILDGMGIFATQELQSEMSPPFQVMLGVEIIQKFILALLQRKLLVHFYGVRGNHGEIRGERGKAKDLNANWDTQLYLILDYWARTVLKNSRVMVAYSELDYLNFEIQGWKYHIRHIAPQQSDTSAGKAKFLGWAKKHDCDVLVYGHFHHYGITDRSGITVIRGGSLTGADEYSEQLAEDSEPIQVLWGCSKNRPVTFMYAIDLGERKKR